MHDGVNNIPKPSILAPAGSKASFLAALAAGADAVYCGLKQFSARMEAKNFSIEELAPLARLARDKGTKVHVTLNALLKPGDLVQAGQALKQLNQWVKPDALIIQDLALVQLAKQTGFSGELHLSTLANVSFSKALRLIQASLGVDRVVLPRELSIDEIKALSPACPGGLTLEVFVHGALCYGVSGRCYWSSYFGGKSGLRGRCVQPCRRMYTQEKQNRRFFSCQDLSLDVLVKVLLPIPNVRTWKIEGRKKGPHYVFYTVKAYRMLRDEGSDPKMKKNAVQLLSRALGRTGTHYNFLPQRPQNPVNIDIQTGSGLFVGNVKGSKLKPFLTPREALLSGDVLRVGYEDESWHGIKRVGKYVPKGGRLFLKPVSNRGSKKGAPVFLTDRREKALEEMLSNLDAELEETPGAPIATSTFNVRLPGRSRRKSAVFELHVHRKAGRIKPRSRFGLWLSTESQKGLQQGHWKTIWWWLPPVVWPDNEEKLKSLIDSTLKKGGRNFVLNAPWQMAFFPATKTLNLWAGPFCNIANAPAVSILASIGFSGAIASPELGRDDYLLLSKNSPLPLGIVISGNWPLCISRILADNIKTGNAFTSPKGEEAWVRKYGADYWVYPNWEMDLRAKQNELQRAGYSLFVHLKESLPKEIRLKKRPGLWNWDVNLL